MSGGAYLEVDPPRTRAHLRGSPYTLPGPQPSSTCLSAYFLLGAPGPAARPEPAAPKRLPWAPTLTLLGGRKCPRAKTAARRRHAPGRRCVLGHSGWWEAGCSLCPDPGRKQSSRGHFSDGTGQCSLACGRPQGPGSPAQGHTSGVCTNYSPRPGHRCSRDAHSVSR